MLLDSLQWKLLFLLTRALKNINQSVSTMYQIMKKNPLIQILIQIKLMNNSYVNYPHFYKRKVWVVLLKMAFFYTIVIHKLNLFVHSDTIFISTISLIPIRRFIRLPLTVICHPFIDRLTLFKIARALNRPVCPVPFPVPFCLAVGDFTF